MHLAEQADPEMAEGFRRLRAAKQQHREALLDMLVKSDPYALPRDPAAGRPADAPTTLERARALDPKRLHVTAQLADVARWQHAASDMPPVAAGG
jgi:ferric-dicitrate binding protein FerR (iron transport regulator)